MRPQPASEREAEREVQGYCDDQADAGTKTFAREAFTSGDPGALRTAALIRTIAPMRADASAIAGELVPIDDLVLVDAGSPIRLPTIELTRARIVLQARRSAGARG